MPVEAGILATDFEGGVGADAADVAWHPSDLAPAEHERRDPDGDPPAGDSRASLREGVALLRRHDAAGLPTLRTSPQRASARPVLRGQGDGPDRTRVFGILCVVLARTAPVADEGGPIEGGPGRGSNWSSTADERERDRVADGDGESD